MPEIYTELTPATSVTHSLTLPFTSPTASNLLIAKTNILQIFTTTSVPTELTLAPSTPDAAAAAGAGGGIDRRDEEQGDFSAELTLQRSQVEDVAKLVLVAEFTLAGEIAGMVRVTPAERSRGNAAGDMLLVAVRDAKLSLLLWNKERFAVETVSLHYYERDEFASPVVGEGLPSQLVADPGMRAVALRFAGDMLAVLPVRQDGEDEEMLDGSEGEEEEEEEPLEDDVVMAESGVMDDTEDWDPTAPDEPENGGRKPEMSRGKKKKEKADKMDLPFLPSFVVNASQLDDAISHVLSLTFLHEYREPTLGILYSPRWTWTGWLEQRKDTTCYIVITLDLDQKASTPIISVQGLPYDLFKVVPLTPPIGGSLLLGANELIHVDQAGKSTGVAVNQFAKRTTNFAGLADQSDLCLALEGSTIVELDGEGGDLLLITKEGTAVIVGFRMDGRNVSGVKVTKIANHPGPLVGGLATTATSLGGRRLFVGCDEGDARILKWRRKGEKKKAIMPGLDEGLEEHEVEDIYNMLDDVDDDLYGGSSTDLSGARKDNTFTDAKVGDHRATGEYVFQTHDRIVNLGPFRSISMGRPTFPLDSLEKQRGVVPELEIIATSGPTNTPEDAGLSLIRRSVAPTIIGHFAFPACRGLWTVRAKSLKAPSPTEAATGQEGLTPNVDEEYDRYLFVSKASDSQVFKVGDAFEELHGSDFDSDGATLEVGVLGEGARIVRVVSQQVIVYDCDMQLSQIVPMDEEETGEEGPAITSAKILDPYVILLRVDGSVLVYKLDKSMELAEEEREGIKGTKYKSGCLYKARAGELLPATEARDTDYILTLLTEDQTLQIFNLLDLNTPIFTAGHFSTLPPLLKQQTQSAPTSPKTTTASAAASATEDIAEALLADLGDHASREPYLIVRSSQDDITFYKAFLTPTSLAFTKTANPIISTPRLNLAETPLFRPMVAMENVGGYACVFLPGVDPAFIMKTAKSIPRLHRLAGTAVRAISSFHTASADRGFVYVDVAGGVRVALLPQDWNFDNPFHAKKIYLGESLRAVAWYDPMSVCIAATTKRVPFSIEEDDGAATPDDSQLKPTIDSGAVVIISPLTWTVVDRYPFAHNEVALIVQTISLEVSEHTKERRQLVTVGTGIFRGEDHSARGGIYVFEVIEVVPEPGKPETNRKLKLVTREEVKGTVSALCGVNGYLLAAQGQKIMVRGLKEDQSLLPVAFMDMNCYVTVAKNFGGLVLFGDFAKSVWFTGFSEEPYKMTLFGKDTQEIRVVAADFLPDGRQLFFVVADANGDVHVLQYDPEHPKSLAGQRLIHRCAFHSPHEILSLTLLPRTPTTPSAASEEQYLLLAATRTGALALITTVPENSYRRLNQLQNQVVVGEEHVAGLNPKAFRHVPTGTGEFLRGVLDRGLLERWVGMQTGKKREVAERAGLEVDAAREWVRSVGEGALTYL